MGWSLVQVGRLMFHLDSQDDNPYSKVLAGASRSSLGKVGPSKILVESVARGQGFLIVSSSSSSSRYNVVCHAVPSDALGTKVQQLGKG